MQVATLAAQPAPASCTTGDWTAKFNCGLHEPANSTVSHVGYNIGHSGPMVIVAVLVLAILVAWIGSRRTPATSS